MHLRKSQQTHHMIEYIEKSVKALSLASLLVGSYYAIDNAIELDAILRNTNAKVIYKIENQDLRDIAYERNQYKIFGLGLIAVSSIFLFELYTSKD